MVGKVLESKAALILRVIEPVDIICLFILAITGFWMGFTGEISIHKGFIIDLWICNSTCFRTHFGSKKSRGIKKAYRIGCPKSGGYIVGRS